MIEKAVFDAGPLIHLAEIDQLSLLSVIDEKMIPEEVYNEFEKHRPEDISIEIENLNEKGKKYARSLVQEYHIDLGEAEAIALIKQKDLRYLFTDDWYAREVAEELGIKVHGSLGIVMRAHKQRILDRSNALMIIDRLSEESSLFITPRIVEKAKIEIEKYDKQR